jgi:hypothetical protein
MNRGARAAGSRHVTVEPWDPRLVGAHDMRPPGNRGHHLLPPLMMAAFFFRKHGMLGCACTRQKLALKCTRSLRRCRSTAVVPPFAAGRGERRRTKSSWVSSRPSAKLFTTDDLSLSSTLCVVKSRADRFHPTGSFTRRGGRKQRPLLPGEFTRTVPAFFHLRSLPPSLPHHPPAKCSEARRDPEAARPDIYGPSPANAHAQVHVSADETTPHARQCRAVRAGGAGVPLRVHGCRRVSALALIWELVDRLIFWERRHGGRAGRCVACATDRSSHPSALSL